VKKAFQPFVFRFESMFVGVLLLSLAPAIRAQTSLESASVAGPALIPIAVPRTPSSTATPQIQTPVDSTAAQTQTQTGAATTTQITARACDLVSSPLTCLDDVLHDQRGIWTAPARLRGRKLLWLVPFAAATSLAFVYDVRAMNALGPSTTRVRVSNDFAHLGSTYVLVPAAGLTYLIGKLDHKEGPRETGMLALESLADAGIVVEALKLATNRQRPYVPPGTGKFWPDDTDVYSFSSSFPSGHAAASFAFARVIVEETPGHPWLHVALYGLATGVAIARVTGENHFPSDALVGSVIGYSIGGYVYHHHSAFYSPKTKSLRVEPLYNPMTASYGVSVSLIP
jgi:membrane-associated phospholipid phosphatase